MCNALGRAADGLAAAGSQMTFFLLQPPLIVLQEALYARLPAAWQGRWWLQVLQVRRDGCTHMQTYAPVHAHGWPCLHERTYLGGVFCTTRHLCHDRLTWAPLAA